MHMMLAMPGGLLLPGAFALSGWLWGRIAQGMPSVGRPCIE